MTRPETSARRLLTGRVLLALWLLAVTLAYFGIGTLIGESATGIVAEQRSWGLAAVALASVLVALVATLLWARGLYRAAPPDEAPAPGLGRRRFLLGAASAAGGVAATGVASLVRPFGWLSVTGRGIAPAVVSTSPDPRESWQGARVRSWRRLGRTDFRVSDISLGSGRIRGELGERIAREAIERGVSYFDTAPDYSAAGSELALGRALQGQRERMFLATKFCTPDGHLQAGSPVEQYVQVVEESLKRLQTDYVDLVHIHACDTLERLLDPNVHEAFERLKQQGKARFLGFSSHTPNLEAVADAALADGRFDVMMLAYHHGSWPRLGEIIDRAAAQDVGVVAMKTLKGAKHRGLEEFRPRADAFSQAAFKWVLGNPAVSCLVISFHELQHLDEYLYASGQTLSDSDLTLLERYDQLVAGTHCRPHCGQCLDSCPEQLAIHDVLRHRMYFEDYGDEKEAMRLYARLEKQADVCLGCNAPCTGACPYGVAIQEQTLGAHRLLSFA